MAGPGTAERLVAGRYRLRSRLGRGGMGTVWLADDELLGRSVAVKEIAFPADLPDREAEVLRERTLREARAAARLDHPAAVTVYDVVQEDGWPYIVMELLRARTLADVVRDDGPLEPREAARVGLAVLGALEAAHALGIVHRDVKPGNIMIRADGRVTLTDFGIATSTGDSTITMTGLLLGSPSYMAPERIEGREPGAPSDLWSLGATMYAAVEGRAPFERDEPLLTLAAVVSGQPAPFRNAGLLAPLIQRLLARDPADRPTAAEARDELLAIVNRRVREPRPPVDSGPALDEPTGAHVTALPRTDVLAAAAAGRQDAEERHEPTTTEQLLPPAEPEPQPPAPVVAESEPKPFFGRLDPPAPVVVAEPEPPAPPIATVEEEPEPPVPVAPVAVRPRVKPSSYGFGPPAARTREALPLREVGRNVHKLWSIAWRLLLLFAILAGVALFFLLREILGDDPGTAQVQPTLTEQAQGTPTGQAGGATVAEQVPPPVQPQPDQSEPATGDEPDPRPSAQATAAETGEPATGTDAVPAGFVRDVDEERGWSVAVPEDWERQVIDGDTVRFSDPATRSFIWVAYNEPPDPRGAEGAWENYAPTFGAERQDYRTIRIDPVDYRDWDAADWESTWTEGGSQVHSIYRAFVPTPQRAFGIWMVTAEQDWDRSQAVFRAAVDSFQALPLD